MPHSHEALTLTIAAFVCSKSLITPSVMINSIKYWLPSRAEAANLKMQKYLRSSRLPEGLYSQRLTHTVDYAGEQRSWPHRALLFPIPLLSLCYVWLTLSPPPATDCDFAHVCKQFFDIPTNLYCSKINYLYVLK